MNDGVVDSVFPNALRQIVHDTTNAPIEGSSLKTVIRQRYLLHATKYARTIGDSLVLPAAFKSNVAILVWFDATGDSTPPKAATRTPTLRTIGIYLSRLASVATDPDRGLAALASDSGFGGAESDAVASKTSRLNPAQSLAFDDFRAMLTSEERLALEMVRALLREHKSLEDFILRDLTGDGG